MPRPLAAVQCEPATLADSATMFAFDVWLTTPARQRAIVRRSIAEGTCFIARDAAHVAGFITWDRTFFDRPFVRLLIVGVASRRRGIARALIAHVERAAAPHRELFISTEHINAPMQALLRTLAYTPSGSIDNINAPGNPELIYHKLL